MLRELVGCRRRALALGYLRLNTPILSSRMPMSQRGMRHGSVYQPVQRSAITRAAIYSLESAALGCKSGNFRLFSPW